MSYIQAEFENAIILQNVVMLYIIYIIFELSKFQTQMK